jgi:2-methylisocitrate lyase-like PEP mutase family enzyme
MGIDDASCRGREDRIATAGVRDRDVEDAPMERMTQIERAREFRRMHEGTGLLLLPNAWDVVSAKLYEVEGFRALGTTSAGIAATLGFADGERMTLEDNLAVCRRIVDHVAIPVSVDLEAGYATSLDGLAESIARAIRAGAAGVNLEDSAKAGCGGNTAGALLEPEAQRDRIATAREVAERAGVPLVINARTDVLLRDGAPSAQGLREAIERGNTYSRAGADCVFVPDMGDLGESEIATLAKGLEAPLNLIAGRSTPGVRRLEALGVARLSFGPRPMRSALHSLRRMAREWSAEGTFTRLNTGGALSYEEVNGWFALGGPNRHG